MKMTLGDAAALSTILDRILLDKDGKERGDIPFKVKYRLVRDRATLGVFEQDFNKERNRLILKYGENTKDEQGRDMVTVPNEKREVFLKDLSEAASAEIDPEIMQIKTAEVEDIVSEFTMSISEIQVFDQFLVSDSTMRKELEEALKIAQEPLKKDSDSKEKTPQAEPPAKTTNKEEPVEVLEEKNVTAEEKV